MAAEAWPWFPSSPARVPLGSATVTAATPAPTGTGTAAGADGDMCLGCGVPQSPSGRACLVVAVPSVTFPTMLVYGLPVGPQESRERQSRGSRGALRPSGHLVVPPGEPLSSESATPSEITPRVLQGLGFGQGKRACEKPSPRRCTSPAPRLGLLFLLEGESVLPGATCAHLSLPAVPSPGAVLRGNPSRRASFTRGAAVSCGPVRGWQEAARQGRVMGVVAIGWWSHPSSWHQYWCLVAH